MEWENLEGWSTHIAEHTFYRIHTKHFSTETIGWVETYAHKHNDFRWIYEGFLQKADENL